jgi:hypothetical protein
MSATGPGQPSAPRRHAEGVKVVVPKDPSALTPAAAWELLAIIFEAHRELAAEQPTIQEEAACAHTPLPWT